MSPSRWWLVLIVLSLFLAACGDDDAVGGNAADTPVGSSDASADDSSDQGGGDDESDGDAAVVEGTGVVTIDGEPYEFTVEFCEGADGSLVRIAGPGTTPDGEPFWVEARWGLGGPIATQLGVGVTEPSAREGDPHYYNSLDDGAQYVSFDDGFAISYEAPFGRAGAPNDPEVAGMVDASCSRS